MRNVFIEFLYGDIFMCNNHLIYIYHVMKNNKNLPLNDPRHYVRQCMTVHGMTQSRKNTESLRLNYDVAYWHI